jgi:hypothetical protein
MSYPQFKIFAVKLKNKTAKFHITKIFYGISSGMLEAMNNAQSVASKEWNLSEESIDIDEVTHISDLDFLPACISGKDCIVCHTHDYHSQAADSQ